MCFTGGDNETPKPQTPAQVLKQDAPGKKTANKSTSKDLSIGSKRYRTVYTGLGSTSTTSTKSSAVPSVSM